MRSQMSQARTDWQTKEIYSQTPTVHICVYFSISFLLTDIEFGDQFSLIVEFIKWAQIISLFLISQENVI